jgi:hypothetical protein
MTHVVFDGVAIWWAVVGIVFLTVSVCITIIGCTWKISGRMSGMETSLSINTAKVNETCTLVQLHAKECDVDRAHLNEKVANQDKRLNSHKEKFDGLSGAPA